MMVAAGTIVQQREAEGYNEEMTLMHQQEHEAHLVRERESLARQRERDEAYKVEQELARGKLAKENPYEGMSLSISDESGSGSDGEGGIDSSKRKSKKRWTSSRASKKRATDSSRAAG